MIDLLKAERRREHQVFGGGGGVIVPENRRSPRLRRARLYSVEDGAKMGLQGMINDSGRAL